MTLEQKIIDACGAIRSRDDAITVVTAAVEAERARCTSIAETEYLEKTRLAGVHRKEGESAEASMDRCFSAARVAARIAEAIRNPPTV